MLLRKLYAERWEHGEYLRNKVFLGKPRHRPLPRYTTKSSWTVCQIKSSLQVDKWKNRLDVLLRIGIIDFIMLGLIQTLIYLSNIVILWPSYLLFKQFMQKEGVMFWINVGRQLIFVLMLSPYFFLPVGIAGRIASDNHANSIIVKNLANKISLIWHYNHRFCLESNQRSKLKKLHFLTEKEKVLLKWKSFCITDYIAT